MLSLIEESKQKTFKGIQAAILGFIPLHFLFGQPPDSPFSKSPIVSHKPVNRLSCYEIVIPSLSLLSVTRWLLFVPEFLISFGLRDFRTVNWTINLHFSHIPFWLQVCFCCLTLFLFTYIHINSSYVLLLVSRLEAIPRWSSVKMKPAKAFRMFTMSI